MLPIRDYLLPPGTLPDARLLLAARALRAFGDGYVCLLLPYYLTLLGYSAMEIGLLVTATLLGSGLMTLAIGFIAHRHSTRHLLLAASILMAATGLMTSIFTDFWPLLIIAVIGTTLRRFHRLSRLCLPAPSVRNRAPRCLRATV